MRKTRQSEWVKRVELLLVFSRGAKSRMSILATLRDEPKNCNQIANETGLGWWTVQKHLMCLHGENFVLWVNFGKIKFYDLTAEGEEAFNLCLEKQKKRSSKVG